LSPPADDEVPDLTRQLGAIAAQANLTVEVVDGADHFFQARCRCRGDRRQLAGALIAGRRT
jgi:alpha/beta superfamily hydrolase